MYVFFSVLPVRNVKKRASESSEICYYRYCVLTSPHLVTTKYITFEK